MDQNGNRDVFITFDSVDGEDVKHSYEYGKKVNVKIEDEVEDDDEDEDGA